MNVDDVGRREGAVLRDRFDGLAAPPPTALTVETSRPRRRGALVGIAAALVVVVMILLFATWRDPGPAAGPGGTWNRFDVRKAFGADAHPFAIAKGGPGLVAIGSRSSSRHPVARAGVWTSSDGERWTAVRGMPIPSDRFTGFSGFVSRRGVLVASTGGGEIWRSTNGTRWRPVADLAEAELDSVRVEVGPRGFVAVGSQRGAPLWAMPVWTSVNGRHWVAAEGSGTVTHPIGLLPVAPLGSSWLSLSNPTSAGLNVFESDDGVRWAVIPGANIPERFALPLASNHEHTRVLGIQYEHVEIPKSFGGRVWSTRDGKNWTEITSFHEQMPVANPDHIVESGKWWVLGGNTGTRDGRRRASMWTSPDLRHWYEMPKQLRGPKTDGAGVFVTAISGGVVGLGGSGVRGSHVWVWNPPD